MANLILDAMATGKSGGSVVDGKAGGTEAEPQESAFAEVEVISDSDSSVSANDSIDESNETPETETPEETEDSKGSAASTDANARTTSKTPSADKETITVSDDKGNRRKLEIDYSDRAAIRKQFELAAGARKWQAERDQEKAARTRDSEVHQKDRRVLDALEAAYAERGEAGVIDLIAGKPGASQDFIQRQIDRAKFLEKASPAEVAQLEQKERLEQLERELSKQRTESEAREKRIVEERETAELRSLESTVHPVFEKHRFDGKLGSSDDEAMFDEMLWNTALKRLKPFEDQGTPMTRELVDREFRMVAAALRKRIGVQAEKKAAAVVDQKKQEATENAQASTVAAYKKGGATAEAHALLNKGDFKSLFSNWGKYGKAIKR